MTRKELKHSIGRLIMARLMVDEFTAGVKYRTETERIVRSGKAGGFCIFGGTPETVAETIASLQGIAKEHYDLPLLFSCDAEWGLTMRLRSGGTEFPHARAFARVKDATLIEEASYRIAMELRALGIWWSFSPVADVNTNPLNPIINIRSYGETAEAVIRSALQVYHGIRRARVIACAKHFPGHGDTIADSHREKATITHGTGWMFSNDLPPFAALIDEGVPSIMTGHIAAPALAARYDAVGKDRQLPATVSRALVTNLLRSEMKFEGMIVTDSLEMGGIRTMARKPGELGVMALGAGVDLLLMPTDTIETHQAIWRAIDMGVLRPEELESSIARIHKLIQWSSEGETPSIEETFQRSRTKSLALKIAEKALKVKGEPSELRQATEILILCANRKADIDKAEECKSIWKSQGITLPITVLSGNPSRYPEFSASPIVVTYDRPHGVLGPNQNAKPIEHVIQGVIHLMQSAHIDPCGVVIIGNPYLEDLVVSMRAPCTILTFSATRPSIYVVGDIIRNA